MNKEKLGYVFIGNGFKPSTEQQMSRKPVNLSNVSRPCAETALEMGYEVWVGVNRADPDGLECNVPVHLYDSHTYRSIFNFKDNYTAYRNAMRVIREHNVDVIHCNTPIGGIIGRLCGKRGHVRKVIYTAHGFHFHKGAPLLHNTVFKWAELLMAHWTDAVLTMNAEDYAAAQKFKLRGNGKAYYVPGVGINTKDYQNVSVDQKALRSALGLAEDDVVCISMGDLIPRKNYEPAIRAVAQCRNEKIKYLICGKGPELERLQALCKEEHVENQVQLLGFRADIKELLQIADIFLFTTLQEGMPRSMMEAMASGLPCIASEIRGNVDLLEEGKGGYLVPANDVEAIANGLRTLVEHPEIREEMARRNLERIKIFDVTKVKEVIRDIYTEVFGS